MLTALLPSARWLRSSAALRLWSLMAAVALGVGGIRSAEAQILPRSAEIDIAGGGYFFGGIGSNLENLKSGPYMGLRLGLNFHEHVAFESSVGYVPTSTHHGGRVSHYLNPHFDLVIHATRWRIVPYFAVGAGFQWYRITEGYEKGIEQQTNVLLRDPYLTASQIEAGHLIYASEHVDFLFDVGGGIKFLIFERGGLRVDCRYLLSMGPGGEKNGVPAWEGPAGNETVVYNDQFHHVELTGSAFFIIGGGPGKDSDGDTIPDRIDECKDRPEDLDDHLDEDGCPDLDNDGDGVLDTSDACPSVAEDLDDWRDSDGCPEPDNDEDGLRDTEDGCPDQAEDPDGFQDSDGCPDPDNDRDGIPDGRDQCPLETEDKDAFRDDDGCPEPDNDGDGIADVADKCPNAPEEVNGIEDDDGCPEADGDGDGVYDGRDRCPGEVEDLDGFQDDDGCPDPDNDGDGLADDEDLCPVSPEDMDGTDDQDGCPDPDNDNDGLLDDKDGCPNKPEDDDGWEDSDGCPDLDNDQDGILDDRDDCPNHGEVINGFEDRDGCPDEIPAELKRFTGVIPDIQFRRASEQLLPSSFLTLNQAAGVLAQYPSVRMEVQGHASSDGDDQYNLELSQRRADSVRQYLISRGVAAARLTGVGYGESQPVASNDTDEGRRRNRRVEFQLVQD